MTTRLSVLTAFAARLADITIANGYATDAGQLVVMGEAGELGESDPDAALAIVPGDDRQKTQAGTVGTAFLEWPIQLVALGKADLSQPWVTLENIVGDIKRAIETGDRRLGGLVKSDLQRGATRIVPREPGSLTIGVSVTYVVTIAEPWGQP